MAKGGARTRSGPAPDPTALRRERDQGEWTTLPAAGRAGAAPTWPLSDLSEREDVMWSALWARPQALMWERYAQAVEVALYVRRLVEAEEPGSAVNLSTLVRQMADSLGLTTPGMRANRWRVAAAEEPAAAPTKRARSARAPSVRDRLKVVPSADEAD